MYGLMRLDGRERRLFCSRMQWFPLKRWKETPLLTNPSISAVACSLP
jgi:hypothetical protein